MDNYLYVNHNTQNRKNFDECSGYIHVVVEGDTLYKLSRKYDVRLSDIMKANPYIDVYNMQVGEEVCVPVDKNFMDKIYTYIIKDGDTLKDILDKYNISLEQLMNDNDGLYYIKLPQGFRVNLPRDNYYYDSNQSRNELDDDMYDNMGNGMNAGMNGNMGNGMNAGMNGNMGNGMNAGMNGNMGNGMNAGMNGNMGNGMNAGMNGNMGNGMNAGMNGNMGNGMNIDMNTDMNDNMMDEINDNSNMMN